MQTCQGKIPSGLLSPNLEVVLQDVSPMKTPWELFRLEGPHGVQPRNMPRAHRVRLDIVPRTVPQPKNDRGRVVGWMRVFLGLPRNNLRPRTRGSLGHPWRLCRSRANLPRTPPMRRTQIDDQIARPSPERLSGDPTEVRSVPGSRGRHGQSAVFLAYLEDRYSRGGDGGISLKDQLFVLCVGLFGSGVSSKGRTP